MKLQQTRPSTRLGMYLQQIVWLFIILAIGISPTIADDPIDQLRVLTYNIHHGQGRDGRLDLNRIASVIKKLNPHLVALQEVDVKTRRSNGVDQVAELARLCDMQYCFGKAINYKGGQYGNAILASRKIIVSSNVPLPNHGGETRTAIAATIKTSRSKQITIVSTHFDHKSPKSRLEAAKKLSKIASTHRTPVILAGDLNCTPKSKDIQPLWSSFRLPKSEEVLTFPAVNPQKQIDYILIDRRENWPLERIDVVDDGGASDHRPLFAVFRISN